MQTTGRFYLPCYPSAYLFLLAIAVTAAQTLAAQTVSARDKSFAGDATTAANENPVIPQQVRFSGALPTRSGDTVEAVFRVYAQPAGGRPLWSETQSISIDRDGHYSVLLGASTPQGLPQSVFAAGLGRWLGINIEQGQELPRTPLASVPYAMKSADAEFLAGRAAAEYVTRDQLAATARALARQTAALVFPGASPALTGTGTANAVPLWTTASNLGNSIITQVGSKVGIAEAAPLATLDLNGSELIRGSLNLQPPSAATASSGVNSPRQSLAASVYSSSAAAPLAQTFTWLVAGLGNNTPAPSATLNLLYANGTANPSLTGLSITPAGVINFSPTQTFPIKGTGGGTITSVSTTAPLTGHATSGAVTLGLNPTALAPLLEPTYNTLYPQLGAANVFSANNVFDNTAFFNGAATFNSTATLNDGISVSGVGSFGATTDNGAAVVGVRNNGPGIGLASSAPLYSQTIAIFADNNGGATSNSFNSLYGLDGFSAALWADGIQQPLGMNVATFIATADDQTSAIFFNNSQTQPTIDVLNNYSGGPTGNALRNSALVLRTEGPGGVCGIDQGGSLSCTGQIKSVVATRTGARQVETYSVQSAENWLEDYGSSELRNGSVTVHLDAAFADVANTGVDFHVFLTPGGDCKGLYVSHKTADSFEVHELGGGKSNIPFDFKIVARRRGHEIERLVDVTERLKLEAAASNARALPSGTPRPAGQKPFHPGFTGRLPSPAAHPIAQK